MRFVIALFGCMFFCMSSNVMAQQLDSASQKIDTALQRIVTIKSIQLKGNKRTKDYIIFREITVKTGETLSIAALQKQLEISRNLVFNTALFLIAKIYVSAENNGLVDIQIEVKERWYFFPTPYFRLIDRNFNQWWVDQKRSLDRVNYGLKFIQGNLTGRNDELNIWLITGYTQQVNFRYNLPFLDKKLKHGFNIGVVQSTQKEVNINTNANKQVFFRSTETIRKLTRQDVTYNYRPDQLWRHSFRLSYVNEWVADTILKLNPQYFAANKNRQQYIDFYYGFRYLNLDYFAYPTKGFTASGYVYKRGLTAATNLWQLGFSALYAKHVWKKAFVNVSAAATIKLANETVFTNQRLFGFGDFQMRGYEYNVIDGNAGILGRATIFQELFGYNLKTYIKSKTYNKIPFKVYLKMYTDVGYAHSNFAKNSVLNNKPIFSGGIGLDIVSIYDFVFRIEYSFNQLGVRGLYLDYQ